MSAIARRALLTSLLLAALLTGCGSNRGPIVCPATSSCGCGPEIACVAPQFLYAAGTNGQVTVFPIAGTGALGSPTSVPGPSMTLGMTALDNQFLYVSNPQPEIGSAVNAWALGSGTGTLTTVPGSPFTLGPFTVAGGLATDSALQVVYVADAARIDALQADSAGALKPISGSPFSAGTGLYLTVDPQNLFLFADDDTPPGNVQAFTINSNGALTAVKGSPFPTTTNSTGRPFLGQIVVDASASFVYVALTSTNQVAAFSITPSTGVLVPVPGSPFTAGQQPLALATAGSLLYVACDGTISGYSINSTTGVLTPLSGSPFKISGGALAIDPIGPRLYASSASGILAFTINPQTGALAPIAGSPFPAPPATVLTVTP